jgi:hypothetical protein
MADNEQIQRATPLKPTIWMTGVLVWATAIGLFLRIPTWAGIFLCTLTGLSFLLYMASYIFLLATDREALRHERHLTKGARSHSGELRGQNYELLESSSAVPAAATMPLSPEREVSRTKPQSI